MLRTHPFIDERETAADEVGPRLQELVGELLAQAIPDYSSLDEPSLPECPGLRCVQVLSDLRVPAGQEAGPKKDRARRARSRSGHAISLKSLNHTSRQPTRLNLAVMYRARWKTSSGIPMWGG